MFMATGEISSDEMMIVRYITIAPVTVARLFFWTDLDIPMEAIRKFLDELVSEGYATLSQGVYTMRRD